ncbi:hypothetical protein BJV74DRAFT_989851 [Russula compacta]|nr:hypothetical protein BJV74DRAFT_989851 [Russula compacta]
MPNLQPQTTINTSDAIPSSAPGLNRRCPEWVSELMYMRLTCCRIRIARARITPTWYPLKETDEAEENPEQRTFGCQLLQDVQHAEPFPSAGQPESGLRIGWDWLDTLDFSQAMTSPMEPPTNQNSQPCPRSTSRKSLRQFEYSSVTQVMDEPGAEEPSAALEYPLDLEHSPVVGAVRSETRIPTPTREEIERSLCHLPKGVGYSTEFGRGVDMGKAGIGILGLFAVDFQDGGWRDFIDFGCLDNMQRNPLF